MRESRFTAEELKQIDKADDLKISPFRAAGKIYGTPTWIWSVVVDGEFFVRAYNGQNSSWYKSAAAQKAGRIYAAGMIKDVVFETVSDVFANQNIDRIMLNTAKVLTCLR